MSNNAMLKFWRSSAAKTLGVTSVIALALGTLVAAPASAVGNDIQVYGWATGANAGRVCVETIPGHTIPGYATPQWHATNNHAFGLSVDTQSSDAGATATIVEIPATDGCEFEYAVSNIKNGVDTYFRFDAWLTNMAGIGGNDDGPGSGSTFFADAEYAHFGQFFTGLSTDNGLAYQNDQVNDERHTTFVCAAVPATTEVDGVRDVYEFNGAPQVLVYDKTSEAWVTDSVSVDVNERTDLADPSCGPAYDYEAYVGDLTLGHTYDFYVQADVEHYVYIWDPIDEVWELEYNHTDWYYQDTRDFTPLDVRQNQVGIFDDNNMHENGSTVYRTWINPLGQEVVRGDSSDNEMDPTYPNRGAYAGLHDLNFTNVDVITPFNLRDGADETDADRFGTAAVLSLYDGPGSLIDVANTNLSTLDGVIGAHKDEASGRWGNLREFSGQAFVTGALNSDGGLYEGLSDSYSENAELNDWAPTRVRATSDTSLEITLHTNLSTDQSNEYLDPREGTYSFRLIPNYGNGTPNVMDWFAAAGFNDPRNEFTGNHDLQRPVRYEAIDQTFEPGTYTSISCMVEGRDTCRNDGYVKFNLTGLDAGTSYSIEVVASFPINSDMDSETDRVDGDGGYDTVQFRDSAYWAGTTLMASKVLNVTRTSAEFAINITDSHFVDKASLLDGGYVGVNECAWTTAPVSTSGNPADPRWDCTAWDPQTETSRRFATEELSRKQVTTRMIGGQLYAIVELTGLRPDRKYEVVFGADYYMTGWSISTPWEYSNRQNMLDTLDGDTCDAVAWGYDMGAMAAATDGGAECYNSVRVSRIYRSAVASFVTVEDENPIVVDASIIHRDAEGNTLNTWRSGATDVTVHRPYMSFLFSEVVSINGVGKTVSLRNRDTGHLMVIPLSSKDVTLESNLGANYSVLEVQVPELAYDTDYEFEIPAGALVDRAGNEFAGLAGRDFYWHTEIRDNVGPKIIAVDPLDESTNVSVNTNLTYTFDENVYKTTNLKYIRVFNEDTGKEVITVNVTSDQVEVDGPMVYVNIPKLAYGTNYYVIIDKGAFVDFNQNESDGLLGDMQNFQTEFDAPPSLIATIPADGSVDVDVNTDLGLTFNETVYKGSVGKYIRVWNADSGKVAVKVDVSSDKVSGSGANWVVELPSLDFNTNYYVTIDIGAFVDSAGNEFQGLRGENLRFRTVPTDTAAPFIISTTPADGALNVDVNSDLTLVFNEPVVKGGVGKLIKVWKASTATVVATVDVTSSQVTIDGATVTVVLPKLEFSTDYYVTIEPGTFLDLNGNHFAGLAGADLEFQTESTDNIAPTLISIETSDVDDNGVDRDTSFWLTFSENVVAGDVPMQLIRKSDDQVVQTIIPSASQNVVINGNVVRFTRDRWLEYSTEYYLYLPAGSFLDDAGNAYAGNALTTTAFTVEPKPAYVGKIKVTASYRDGWRDFDIKMGKKFAYSGYKLIRVERATGRLVIIKAGFLNEDGWAAVSADVNHLHRLDDVYVRIGRHYLAYTRVKTN